MLNVLSIKQWLNFKGRRKPNCYLFSSKSILVGFIIILVYLLTMDIILIGKIRNRGPFKTYSLPPKSAVTQDSRFLEELTTQKSSTNRNVSRINLNNLPNSIHQQHEKTMFWPLPVKKMMMADATHFLRSPIAELVESVFCFSEIFPFVTANLVSFFHNVLSLVSIRFLAHDQLFWRQFGVGIFQFRNFLDSFDGVLYRAHARRTDYKSNYGSIGYFVDAVSDTFGGICLVIAIIWYFYKHPPPHKKLTRCFQIIDSDDSESEKENQGLCIKNVKSLLPYLSSAPSPSRKSESSYLYNQLNQNESHVAMQSTNGDPQKPIIGYLHASRLAVYFSVAMIGLRIAMSAIFWDRSVHNYQDLLDIEPSSLLHQDMQVLISRSSLTVILMFLWRFFNALYLQDVILAAIFIDKTWELIVKTQWIGWLTLISLIILTELHVAQISSILSIVTTVKS